MSSQIHEQISETLKNKEIINRHSFFQLRYFLIGKEPTHQSRMWRCIRELEVRKQSIEGANIELEDISDKKELMEIETEKLLKQKTEAEMEGKELNIRELDVKLRRMARRKAAHSKSVETLQKKLKEIEEEAVFLLTAFEKLEELEPLKPYDDMKSQMEFWNQKISQEIQLRSLQGLPLDLEVMKTALALDDKMPVKQQLLGSLASAKKLMTEKMIDKTEVKDGK
jgi:hypothetical protein